MNDRTLLIRDADLLVTMDDKRRELPGASLLIRGPQIEAIWPAGERPIDAQADDIAYSSARFNMTPTEYADSVGWLGDDVWHAHCVKLDTPGIARFAATGTGVAHCPCSNMRLASGIAPLRRLLDAGVPVGLGVDGSASMTAPTCWARLAPRCCWRGWANRWRPLAATPARPTSPMSASACKRWPVQAAGWCSSKSANCAALAWRRSGRWSAFR